MTTQRTVTRSLSLYPDDWERLDRLAEKLERIEGYSVKAPRVVRNLLRYGDQLVKDAKIMGGLVKP